MAQGPPTKDDGREGAGRGGGKRDPGKENPDKHSPVAESKSTPAGRRLGERAEKKWHLTLCSPLSAHTPSRIVRKTSGKSQLSHVTQNTWQCSSNCQHRQGASLSQPRGARGDVTAESDTVALMRSCNRKKASGENRASLNNNKAYLIYFCFFGCT